MSRPMPDVSHACHVCGLHFVVRNLQDDDREFYLEPGACPRCGAPLRFGKAPDIGTTKSWLLTLYNEPQHRKLFGSAEQFLAQQIATAADIDQHLAAVAALDYDQWVTFNEELRGGRKPNAAERAEDKALAKIRQDAAAGLLLPRLQAIADQMKTQLAAENAPYLAKLAAPSDE